MALTKRAVRVAAVAVADATAEEVEATITAVTTDNECCVKECKDRRHDPTRGSLYCKKHSDPKTRCRKCNQGLADGNETNWCSICYLLFHKECYVIDCKEPRTGTIYCQHHSDPKTRCRKCKIRGLVEGSSTLCSTCIGALSCGHCNESFSSIQRLRYHVDNNVCIRRREARGSVERERSFIPNKENVVIIFKLVLSFL